MMSLGLMEAFAFSLPIVCAMVCMVMMSLDACRYGRGGQERRLRALLALTYLVTSLGWLGLVLYSVAPCAFSYYHPVFLLTLMLDQVMFFWVVSMITDTGERRRLNRWHWVVPVFLMGALFEGGILVSLVFFIYNTLYPAAKPPEHISLQAVHRRLLVGGAAYLLGLAGGRASFYLGLRTRSAGGIVARYGDFLLFLFRVAGGVANVRVLYDALL